MTSIYRDRTRIDLAHCRIELLWIKAAPLRSAAGPASAPGSALGGPPGARRATHRRDPQTKVAQRATTGCSDEPSSPGSRLSRSRPPRQWRPYPTVARAVLDHQVPAITLRDPGATAHPGLPPRTPRLWARPPLVLTTLLPARHAPSLLMKPARGHPAPRLQAGHLAHDDALGTTGEMCKGTPPFPPPPQLWIASGWRQARPCPQGNRSRSKCLVNVHAKTGLTLSSGSLVWRRSGNGGGLAGPTGQATNRPVMPEQPDLF